ncbi:MAG: carboxypeptidase-like regulatory domain-containing protein, partial [Acidobacteria bacterium]|nr:carboxypeptidase-like regulatory domain-containing protein [Acidobacteriota bacterium]
MTFVKKLACVIFVVTVVAGNALAQGVATADLRGTITDPQGAVVSAATVTIRDRSRNIQRSAVTNADGEYLMLAVP